MEKIIQELRDWGCDMDATLERFMGDLNLYDSCLKAVVVDKAFAGLGEALKNNDIEGAFDQAHTLKGVLANMGLTPMYDIVVKIVEPLRAGAACAGVLAYYEELLQANDYLKGLIG